MTGPSQAEPHLAQVELGLLLKPLNEDLLCPLDRRCLDFFSKSGEAVLANLFSHRVPPGPEHSNRELTLDELGCLHRDPRVVIAGPHPHPIELLHNIRGDHTGIDCEHVVSLTGADRTPLSEDDANELLESELATSFEPQLIEGNASIPVDAFVIDAFDKISGERFAMSTYDGDYQDLGFIVFPDAIAACAYLIHEVLPHDEQVRANGYRLCHGGGSPGSQDPDRESRVTSSIVAALRKTLLNALTKGYRPEHGLHVRRLMQDATVTFEVTEIGYLGDLLFYGTADGRAIEDRVDPDDPEDLEEIKRAARQVKKLKAARGKIVDQVTLPPEIAAQLRKLLGQAYDMLAVDSRVIAANVVEEFNRMGMRPSYDYAGISMKASKLIERELTIRVFRPWRDAVRKEIGKDRLSALREEVETPPVERTEQVLIQWLQKQSKLDLGKMRFCLRGARQATASMPLQRLLAEYLGALSDGRWLSSDEFESALLDISTKYRNGGVHEHVVTFETCREAVNRILVGPHPLLQRLMEATAGSNGK